MFASTLEHAVNEQIIDMIEKHTPLEDIFRKAKDEMPHLSLLYIRQLFVSAIVDIVRRKGIVLPEGLEIQGGRIYSGGEEIVLSQYYDLVDPERRRHQ